MAFEGILTNSILISEFCLKQQSFPMSSYPSTIEDKNVILLYSGILPSYSVTESTSPYIVQPCAVKRLEDSMGPGDTNEP